jgi:hypothetical protein
MSGDQRDFYEEAKKLVADLLKKKELTTDGEQKIVSEMAENLEIEKDLEVRAAELSDAAKELDEPKASEKARAEKIECTCTHDHSEDQECFCIKDCLVHFPKESDVQAVAKDLTPEQIEEMEAKRKSLEEEQLKFKSQERLETQERHRLESLQAEKTWAKENRKEIINSFGTGELDDILYKISNKGLSGLTEIERLEWLGARCRHSIYPPVEGREVRPLSIGKKYRLAKQHRTTKVTGFFKGCIPLARRTGANERVYPKNSTAMRRVELEMGSVLSDPDRGHIKLSDLEEGKVKLPVLLKSATREQIAVRLLEIEREEQLELIEGIDNTIDSLKVLKSELKSEE